MAKRLVCAFAGTGSQAEVWTFFEPKWLDNVVRVYFNGCQDPRIGGVGGYVNPNLDIIASKLRSCFSHPRMLSLAKLKKKFGSAIIIEGLSDEQVEIEDITLFGDSRGGVTTFAASRYLDDLGLPIALLAIEPVPGNSKKYAGDARSEFYKNQDLRGCRHLRYAHVLLGCYQKGLSSVEDKYYRQMVPLFSSECIDLLYIFPKWQHATINNKELHHLKSFLYHRGLIPAFPKDMYYLCDISSMFFIPKILQQKHHTDVTGRMQLTPYYKRDLLAAIRASGHLYDAHSSVKQGQALYALDFAPSFPSKHVLYERVKTDRSPEGKALREFIVEFENIIQAVLFSITSHPAANQLRQGVYEQVAIYPERDADFTQKHAFFSGILMLVSRLKPILSSKFYAKFLQVMHAFLIDNTLCHPDLTQYIDEEETFGDMVERRVLRAVPTLSTDYAARWAERLYHMSVHSRDAEYDNLSMTLHYIISDVGQLGKILRFLPPKRIDSLLKKKEMNLLVFQGSSSRPALITHMNDINRIMEKLFTEEQRDVVFHRLQEHIGRMGATVASLEQLKQYLSPAKWQILIKLTRLTRLTAEHVTTPSGAGAGAGAGAGCGTYPAFFSRDETQCVAEEGRAAEVVLASKPYSV